MTELHSTVYSIKYTIQFNYIKSHKIKTPLSLTNRFTTTAPNYDTV